MFVVSRTFVKKKTRAALLCVHIHIVLFTSIDLFKKKKIHSGQSAVMPGLSLTYIIRLPFGIKSHFFWVRKLRVMTGSKNRFSKLSLNRYLRVGVCGHLF